MLAGDTTVGLDAGGAVVVTVDGNSLAKRFFRVFPDRDQVFLEAFGAEGDVRLDGEAVQGKRRLDRQHVIGLRDRSEFVFSRAAGSAGDPAVATDQDSSAAMQRQPSADPDGVVPLPKNVRAPLPKPAQKLPPPTPPPRATTVPRGFGTDPEDAAFESLIRLGNPRLAGRGSEPPHHDEADATTGKILHSAESVYRIAVVLPARGEAVFPLRLGDNVVGRGKGSDIRIPDDKKLLSRRHAIIRVGNGRVELIDLDTANGTFVNEHRIASAIIPVGGTFKLGPDLTFTLRGIP